MAKLFFDLNWQTVPDDVIKMSVSCDVIHGHLAEVNFSGPWGKYINIMAGLVDCYWTKNLYLTLPSKFTMSGAPLSYRGPTVGHLPSP